MQEVKELTSTETLILGQEPDEMRALGMMWTLAMLAPTYGGEKAFSLFERLRAAVSAKTYGLVYERTDEKAPVSLPVGFVTYGYLSRPCEVIFAEGLRPLQRNEHGSGNRLWVLDLVAPLGHTAVTFQLFGELHAKYPSYKCINATADSRKKALLTNGAYEEPKG